MFLLFCFVNCFSSCFLFSVFQSFLYVVHAFSRIYLSRAILSAPCFDILRFSFQFFQVWLHVAHFIFSPFVFLVFVFPFLFSLLSFFFFVRLFFPPLPQGADVNAKDKDEISGLMEASIMGHVDVVKELLKVTSQCNAQHGLVPHRVASCRCLIPQACVCVYRAAPRRIASYPACVCMCVPHRIVSLPIPHACVRVYVSELSICL